MQLRILTADDVRRALPMADAIEAMRRAFAALEAGQVTMPVRQALATERGTMLFMPAHIHRTGSVAQKVVGVYGQNPARGLPTIHALVTLYAGETGQPRALLEGSLLTQIRTGAVSGLATDLLARADARTLTIFGAGAQAPAQIEAICTVRPIEEVWIVSRGDSAAQLAETLQRDDPERRYRAANDPEQAVRAADVIVTVTSSGTPVFEGDWVSAGTHVNGVGSFRPSMQEVDVRLLQRAQVIVDDRAAAAEEAGELIIAAAHGEWHWNQVYAELGALVTGRVAPPAGGEGITFFKSCGLAIQDLAAAEAALQTAEAEGWGQVVDLG